jgi:hypothetical protein
MLCIHFGLQNGLGYILVEFLKNSPNHPDKISRLILFRFFYGLKMSIKLIYAHIQRNKKRNPQFISICIMGHEMLKNDKFSTYT